MTSLTGQATEDYANSLRKSYYKSYYVNNS